MTGVKVRDLGTTGKLAPNIKRSSMILSNGRSVIGFADTNRTGSNGEDVTGVAKIYLWVSGGADHAGPWTRIDYTPAVACASSTRQFVGSFSADGFDRLYCVYAGTDNSLRLITWSGYNGTTAWGGVSEQVIRTATAVTNRWRALDMDLTTTQNPVIIAYEAVASNGQGAWARIFSRRNDAVTWVQSYERQVIANGNYIRSGGEDVSISLGGPPASNVVKVVYFATQVATTVDSGDLLIELSFNIDTASANTATVVGTWHGGRLNQHMASGARRGWLFSMVANRWMFANSVGTSAPFFEGTMLTSGLHGPPTRNRIGTPPSGGSTTGQSYWLGNRFTMFSDANAWGQVTASYSDNTLIFAFAGIGDETSRSTRMLVMKWPSPTAATASKMDTTARMMDNGYRAATTPIYPMLPLAPKDGVIGVYGGNNKNLSAGRNDWDFAVMYGVFGDAVSLLPLNSNRELRIVYEDQLPAPQLSQPKEFTTVTNNRPLFRLTFQNGSAYSNVYARPVWEVARDELFTVDARIIKDSAAPFESMSSTGGAPPVRILSYQMKSTDSALYSGEWYIRAWMEDDLGGVGAACPIDVFVILHPPVALPLSPGGGTTVRYDGDVLFSWRFTDPEPSNTQSAYQILVERLDTGAVVNDSGKVISSAKSVNLALDSGLVDVPLQWRIRLWDNDDVDGAYSEPLLFSVAEPPEVVITSPTQGEVITTALPVFEWTFTAGGIRVQRAYRVIVYDDTTEPAEVVADSGWMYSSGTSHTFATQILTNNRTYSVTVQVQDNVGLYSEGDLEVEFSQLLLNWDMESELSIDPVDWLGVTGTTVARTDTVVHRGDWSLEMTAAAVSNPHVDSISFPVTPGGTVRAWGWLRTPVAVPAGTNLGFNWFTDGVYVSTFAGQTQVLPVDTWTYFETSAVVPPAITEANVRFGLVGTPGAGTLLYADDIQANKTGPEIVTFITDWIEPPAVVPVLTQDKFKVTATWDNTLIDSDFVAWRLYRRYMVPIVTDFDDDNTAEIWVLVHQTSNNGEDGPIVFNDYTLPFGKPADYVVVQLVDRFGSLIESNITDWATITHEGNRYYFIPEVPVGSIASFESRHVVGDGFVKEVEQETVHVVGRGRQVQIGDDLGYTGSLEVHLRNHSTAREDREFLEYLASPKVGNVFLKSPFGDLLRIRLGPIQVTRIPGGGAEDLADLTVPYLVVFDENPPLTRRS